MHAPQFLAWRDSHQRFWYISAESGPRINDPRLRASQVRPMLDDMVTLQLETGMLPGELVAMRSCDTRMVPPDASEEPVARSGDLDRGVVGPIRARLNYARIVARAGIQLPRNRPMHCH